MDVGARANAAVTDVSGALAIKVGMELTLPSGRPRARRRADSQKTVKETSSHQTDPAANGSNVTPTDPGVASVPTSPPIKREPESTEIEALLMTHRARVPLALSVAQDYSAVPFRVPRPFIALGFFWIVDAWVSRLAPLI